MKEKLNSYKLIYPFAPSIEQLSKDIAESYTNTSVLGDLIVTICGMTTEWSRDLVNDLKGVMGIDASDELAMIILREFNKQMKQFKECREAIRLDPTNVNGVYPRSCPKCGLGPCQDGYDWGKPPAEAIHHPEHYGGKDNPFEAIKIIEHFKLGFCLGNVIKYILRAGKKDPNKWIEDLKKARWYLDREIQYLENESNTSTSTTTGN